MKETNTVFREEIPADGIRNGPLGYAYILDESFFVEHLTDYSAYTTWDEDWDEEANIDPQNLSRLSRPAVSVAAGPEWSAGSGRAAGHGSFRLFAACGSRLGQMAEAVPVMEGAVPVERDAGRRLKF